MNVLNVEDIERELRRYAARLYHAHAKRWVMTVARNYLLGKLPEKDVSANFREVCLCGFAKTVHLPKRYKHDPEKHDPKELPPWAVAAITRGETLMWFDPVQVRRRELWAVLEVIVLWFNNWKSEDTRLPRVDRISFTVATNAAVLWYRDVSENIWNYVTDKPVVVKEYDSYRWVKLVTALQFEREGRLMNHCIGNGHYYQRWRMNGQTDYFSLRDKFNKPHATLEIAFTDGPPRRGTVHQCKGNGNNRPDKEYQPYIRQFIQDMQWSVSGDHSQLSEQ